jgi:sugar phosphate permease
MSLVRRNQNLGTVICNLAFGAASFMGMLWLFIVLRGIDGYAQSFGDRDSSRSTQRGLARRSAARLRACSVS